MEVKRSAIETVTEVILSFVLIGIIGASFLVVTELNPVAAPVTPVLGAATARTPWTFLQDSGFVQDDLVATSNSFNAGYTFTIAQQPFLNYTLFSLNNTSNKVKQYQIVFSTNSTDLKSFKITAAFGDKNDIIYDPMGDKIMHALVVSLPANASQNFSLQLAANNSAIPDQLNGNVFVKQL